jgi:xanthine/CO dehydrogenase XdhC/CoxF family maturation factor
MKEIADIIKAYRTAVKEKKRCALATVVRVEGSSYRRPGARMLITEDGILTGAISGGCLEGDALRKALTAIHQQENKLITYDTTDEDDAKFGVQLGCNGIVQILFEPVLEQDQLNPLSILNLLENKREDAVLITLFSLAGNKQLGTSMIYRNTGFTGRMHELTTDQVQHDAEDTLTTKKSGFGAYSINGEGTDAFLEFIPPALQLVIVGAGNDAQPLARIAHILGWEVTVADGRPTHCTLQRFPTAKQLIVAKPTQAMAEIGIDRQTALVLMTHNYNYDLKFLALVLSTRARYIGTLGPKTKLIRMLEEIGGNSEIYLGRIHGPVGLDIGAETAEEIALSIASEIKAVFSGATAGMLKEKQQPIHFYQTNS